MISRRACIVAFLLLWISASHLSADEKGEWADGHLKINGETVVLRHAYVKTTTPGELKVALSDVPLTSEMVRDESNLMESARAGNLSALVIRVSENGKGRISASVYDRRLKDANTGSPDFGDLKITRISRHVVDAQFNIPERAVHTGEMVEGFVQFHALPARGESFSIDNLLDEHPGIRGFLDRAGDFVDSVGAWLVLVPFFLLVAAALVWALVIAPKKATRLFRVLQDFGYHEIDRENPEMMNVLERLAPFSLEGPSQPIFLEYKRVALNAAEIAGAGPQYIVNSSQRYDTPGHGNTLWQTIACSPQKLDMSDEIYIRPRSADHPWSGDRAARFGLREMPGEGRLDPDFSSDFSVWTQDGRQTSVPQSLQQVFVSMRDALVQPAELSQFVFRKDLLHGFNSKFGPDGWSLCASNVWLQKQTLQTFAKVTQTISRAFH